MRLFSRFAILLAKRADELFLDAARLLGSRRLFLRLRRVADFGLFLRSLFLVRFRGFVAHGFSWLIGCLV